MAGDAADDAFDAAFHDAFFRDHDDDEDFDPIDGAVIRFKRCKYCGAGRLHWVIDNDRWRLSDDHHRLHACVEYREAQEEARIEAEFWMKDFI